ncbi:Hypothetical protein D9617_7g029980 [Elsinoe fawcettii]|nr:Hypothetical protein D9617_7g029980 [Elsinoe fawcettii]
MDETLRSALTRARATFGREFNVLGEPMKGHSNHIHQAVDIDGRVLCIRIPVDTDAGALAAEGHYLLEKVNRQCPALLAPTVYAVDNLYLILDFIPGEPLGSWSRRLLDLSQKKKYLDEIARFCFTLWTTKVDEEDSRLTYSQWLYDLVDKGLKRALTQTNSRWGDPIHFLTRRVMVDRFTVRDEVASSLVRHGDFNAWNVIVDGGSITGIVDWDTARIVPAAAAIHHPLFIADVPGWLNDGNEKDESFEDDRAYLESAIVELHGKSSDALWIQSLLQTSYERQFFELSLYNQKVNEKYISIKLVDIECDRGLMQSHFETFLQRNTDLQAHPNVLALWERLS